MLLDVLVAILISAAIFAFVWAVKGVLLTPVRTGKDVKLTTVVSVKGSADELEQTISGLMWLRESGKLEMDVVLFDTGLTPEAQKMMEILAQKNGKIILCPKGGLEKLLEERLWTAENTQR